jgi:peptide/nickel transport system substrate-binding protein
MGLIMKTRQAASACLLASLILAGGLCLRAEPGRSSTLRIGIDAFPVSLNPVYATTETAQAVVNKVFNGLFSFDGQGRIRNELVEKYEIKNRNDEKKGNPPGQTRDHVEIIIRLKKKIFFSDGKELDADDVVGTVKLLQDRAFKYPAISNLRFITKVEKLDRYRFKLVTSSPRATWQNNLTFKILNAREIETMAKGSVETFKDMILSGTGPYRLKTVKRPSKILLELNEVNPLPGVEKMFRFLEYRVISYPHLSPLKLINNEIDICELQPGNVEAYQHSKPEKWLRSFAILKYKKFGYTYLVFNLRNSLITINLRRLFYNLLVYGDFPGRFLKGRGEQVKSPFLLLSPKVEPVRLQTFPLEKPVPLKILTNAESKLRKEWVMFLREELKPFKILIQPVFLEYHSFLESLKQGRYDIAVSGFILDIDYDMSEIFSSNAYFNYSHFGNVEMDRLLEQGLSELNPYKREEIYVKAHRLWEKELPLLPLFNLYYFVGVSRRVAVPAQTVELMGSEGDFLYNIRQWEEK